MNMHRAPSPVALLLAFAAAAAPAGAADDPRQLAPLPPAAEAALREEMRGNLVALNEIVALLAAGKVREAGDKAERALGMSAMGKHRDKPMNARPGPNMPPAMHELGVNGHRDASAFARAAAGGDREQALAALPTLFAACVACHHAYRIR
jgi:hypothetical protein